MASRRRPPKRSCRTPSTASGESLGREAIETRSPGYVLRIDPGAIDARRFERLVRDAAPLPPAERSAALGDALALWRGTPFADLAFEPFLQAEIARLDEVRLTALEDRLEAEVELGRHDEAIAAATSLHSLHTDRERVCRLTMLALHRAGRQQDALDTYEATRRALDEQWGLEPSPETRALQMMILTQDPAIASSQPVRRAVGAVRRPVSLLLVEPLLDDDLELELAGAAFEDVRTAAGDVAARHGGLVSPESGVELVVAFGVDGAHEDDVVRAARAAVELREILRGHDVPARYAVGTGRVLVWDSNPVLVGAVLGRTRRALHDAEADDVQLTAVAARVGGDAFDLDVDGRLLAVRSTRPLPASTPAPLVDRTDELAALHAAFDAVVATARPRHVVVVGEAGIGKSRLVEAFADEVPAVVLRAACVSYGEGISFLPLLDLWDGAAEIDDGVPPLGELASADAAFAAARALVEHFTRSGPVVVVLDDMHWAVPTFLDLVEYVVRTVDGPLFVVSMTRPELLEQRPSWREGAIGLTQLTAEDARRLVDALPERDAVDDELALTILGAAEGVPLFLEQLVAHAVHSGWSDDDRVPVDARRSPREPHRRARARRARRALPGGGRGSRVLRRGRAGASPRSRSCGSWTAVSRRSPGTGSCGRAPASTSSCTRSSAGRRTSRSGVPSARRCTRVSRDGWPARARPTRSSARTSNAPRPTRPPGAIATHWSREAAERLGGAGFRALMASDHAAAANLLGRAASLLPEDDPARMELECSLARRFAAWASPTSGPPSSKASSSEPSDAGERRLELRAEVELVHSETGGRYRLAGSTRFELLEDALAVFQETGDTLGLRPCGATPTPRSSETGRGAPMPPSCT